MNQRVVEEMWAMAAKAEAGEIIGVAFSVVTSDHGTGSSFVLGDATFAGLLGSVHITAHRLLIAGEKEPLE